MTDKYRKQFLSETSGEISVSTQSVQREYIMWLESKTEKFEQLNAEMLEWLKFIQKYISEDDYTALELLIEKAGSSK